MATRIRLRRGGRKKQPTYRIVVTDKLAPRDGRFIETIGHYNPRTEPITLEVKVDRAREWLGKGATPSQTVHGLLKKAGVYDAAAAAAAPAAAAADSAAPAESTASAEPAASAEAPAPAEPAAE